MPEKLLVLVIEDEELIQNLIKRTLKRFGLSTIAAYTLDEARKLFDKHSQDLLLIVLDGSLVTDNDTVPLAQEFCTKFDRPMVAISGNKESNNLLMNAGCTHHGPKPYDVIPAILNAVRLAQKFQS